VLINGFTALSYFGVLMEEFNDVPADGFFHSYRFVQYLLSCPFITVDLVRAMGGTYKYTLGAVVSRFCLCFAYCIMFTSCSIDTLVLQQSLDDNQVTNLKCQSYCMIVTSSWIDTLVLQQLLDDSQVTTLRCRAYCMIVLSCWIHT
jgi:hypothetical protein